MLLKGELTSSGFPKEAAAHALSFFTNSSGKEVTGKLLRSSRKGIFTRELSVQYRPLDTSDSESREREKEGALLDLTFQNKSMTEGHGIAWKFSDQQSLLRKKTLSNSWKKQTNKKTSQHLNLERSRVRQSLLYSQKKCSKNLGYENTFL